MIALPNLDTLGLVFFTALFLSLFIVPITVMLARKVGAVDIPKQRSSHSVPITRLGGLGIAASLVLSGLMFLPSQSFTWAFLAGLLVIVATGLVDDIADIGPRWKFVGQIVAAGVFVLLGDHSLEHLGAFLGLGEMTLDSLAIPFTIFCMVGGMNAFNLADGLDGLAAGLAAIAAVFFAYFSWLIGALDLLLVCLSLLGAVLGFLRYNSYPARLFMGDSGSLTLGYVLAAVLVSGSQRNTEIIPLVAWVVVVALPLVDTLLVMARRVRHGQSPFRPDRTHLHHRLNDLGLAHPAVVAVMYVTMAVFGLLGVLLRHVSDGWVFFALCLTGVSLFGLVSGMQHLGVSFNAGRPGRSNYSMRQWPLFRQIAQWVGLVVVPASYLLIALMCVPALFFPLPELNRSEALALLLLAGVTVFYCVSRTQVNHGMLYGAVYVSIFALMFVYNLGSLDESFWHGVYLQTIAVLAASWVVIKLIFRKNTVFLNISGFELLMVLLSWFLPFVLLEDLRLQDDVIEAGRMACLQVIPFMFTAKIFFNTQPQKNQWMVGALSGAMLVIVLRSLL
ncbi:MAG: MraY family glycosyltransferase [Sideroxydans sp.]|jgi:UDP-GlcNAc:undecaprenyl-phosphate GlcNAc-1-phosphate transferase